MTSWPLGYRLLELEEVDSTNEEARRRAASGEPGPLWITAARQTKGKGRRGRVWTAPVGNLSATLLLRPSRRVVECAQLSFVAALAAADMLALHVPDVALKWPNDVLVGGRKIAGILLESEAAADGTVAWLAIGIGVNLKAFPDDTELPATAVAALGRPAPSPQDALLDLADRFAKWYEAWRAAGFAPVREAWLARAHGLGARIRVRLAREETTGVFRDIDDAGALVLALPGGVTRTIAAGEVFF
ncbi:biotin--[acetyl-CoA-carboxylase] ligase [Rhizomicrobium electricum]|uniref:biotin--[biotin carboxyl-carrier protein] ligase n=1 Tax=Rhizomicrobium electricum TaxID=480070 RepID=A0ABP3PPU6_9PROT|nr:biotin--[acetyl-CoA-carboxylase] ligase [Rhizomicrobium electricum]NIJ48980.1 BirA family biotin operon repressor/biotin-[acetyl-CoA-carboxylase] ligase [Rhizomicrobium electricum]